MLADSTNGYTGKEGGATEHGLAHRVVMELVNDKRQGYIVYTINVYSSPALFKALMDSGFGACGIARKDRRGIPKSVSTANLQKGEIQSTRDEGILSLKWRDKRDVLMLSTFCDDTMVGKSRRSRTAVGGVETIQKPKSDFCKPDSSEGRCGIILSALSVTSSIVIYTVT